LLPSAQWFDRTVGAPMRRLEATQDYPSPHQETLHRMKKLESEGPQQNWYNRVKPSFSIQGTNPAEVARHLKRMKKSKP